MGPITTAVKANIDFWDEVDSYESKSPDSLLDKFVDHWRLKMDMQSELYTALQRNYKYGER